MFFCRNFGLGGSDGAVAIDLVNMKTFSMDETTWHASIGSGYLLGEIDTQLHNHGARAAPHGICPGVGIGGHATVVSKPWKYHSRFDIMG